MTTTEKPIETAARERIAEEVEYQTTRRAERIARIASLAAAPEPVSRQLMDAVQGLAETEAALAAWASVARYLDYYDKRQSGPDGFRPFRGWADEVAALLVRNLRLDDSWSGHGNDLRRVQFAATLDATQKIVELLRTGYASQL